MDIDSTRNDILESDSFVLEEVTKLQHLYELKHEIRYGRSRNEEIRTESVAEHVYGMQLLADYFLPLEDEEGAWDRDRISKMILWHDMDEIIVGDIIGYLKTEADRKRETEAKQKLISELPEHRKGEVTSLLQEYDERETIESKFVKAIDKLEPSIQSFNENGKQIFLEKESTIEQHRSIKDPYIEGFQYIKSFNEAITAEMVEQGFFVAPK